MRGKTPPIHLTGMPMLEWGGVWDARHPKLRMREGSSPSFWPKWGRFFGKRGDQGPIQRAVERIAPYTCFRGE